MIAEPPGRVSRRGRERTRKPRTTAERRQAGLAPKHREPSAHPAWQARVGILVALLTRTGPMTTRELLAALPWGPELGRQVLAAADGERAWFADGRWSLVPSRKTLELEP